MYATIDCRQPILLTEFSIFYWLDVVFFWEEHVPRSLLEARLYLDDTITVEKQFT